MYIISLAYEKNNNTDKAPNSTNGRRRVPALGLSISNDPLPNIFRENFITCTYDARVHPLVYKPASCRCVHTADGFRVYVRTRRVVCTQTKRTYENRLGACEIRIIYEMTYRF